MVAQQVSPPGGAENISEVNTEYAQAEIAPAGFGELLDDFVPVDGVAVLSVEAEGDESGKHYKSQDQLSFIQANSDGDAAVYCMVPQVGKTATAGK